MEVHFHNGFCHHFPLFFSSFFFDEAFGNIISRLLCQRWLGLGLIIGEVVVLNWRGDCAKQFSSQCDICIVCVLKLCLRIYSFTKNISGM